jgi:hypothetical protein
MLQLLSATALIYRTHVGSVARSGRFWFCLIVCVLFSLIALPIAAKSDSGVALARWSIVSLNLLAPLVGLVIGAAVLTEEVENRTITFLFTRPMPRAALLLGRWLTSFTGVALILGTTALLTSFFSAHPVGGNGLGKPTVVLERQLPDGEWDPIYTKTGNHAMVSERGGDHSWYGVRHLDIDESVDVSADSKGAPRRLRVLSREVLSRELPAGMAGRFLLALVLAGAVYSLFTTVLAIFVKRAMIVGFGYAFAVEGLLANIPGSTQALSLQYYARSILVEPALEAWKKSEMIPAETELLGATGAFVRLAVLLVLALAFGAWAIGRKQFVLTS